MPDTRHAPHREAPEATLRAVADFCNRLFRDHQEGAIAAHAAEADGWSTSGISQAVQQNIFHDLTRLQGVRPS